MSERFLTPTELHHRLAQQDHIARRDRGDASSSLDVRPPPETIVTVGVDPDVTLKPAYRERYFACAMDEQGRPVAELDPAFAIPGLFAGIASEESTPSCFLAGPVRWLLVRLSRLPRVLLWPESRHRDPEGKGFVQPCLLEQLPSLSLWLAEFVSRTAPVGAVVLDLSGPQDCQVLWEVSSLVGNSFEDFFVADEDASEVYLLHHHEKVVVSVPDQHTRWLLLEELAQWSDTFEDWSGYYSPMDEEEEEVQEEPGEE